MKAVVLLNKSGKYQLKLQELPKPVPKKGEALIRVKYCGVNHLDLLVLRKHRVGPKRFPHILGSEIVGEFKGRTVTVYPWIFCGECKLCQSGFENICDYGGTIGRTSWGGFAEYAAVPIKNLIPLPKHLPLIDSCAIVLAGSTALHLLDRLKVTPNSTVFITGASGSVGTIVVQLLKRLGCKMVASTSSKDKKKLLLDLGVDYVVSTNEIPTQVFKHFPGGVDFAIDIVGGSIWSKTVETLAKNGSMAFCATSLNDPGEINIGSAFSKQLNIFGSYGGTIADLNKIFRLLKDGTIKPIVEAVYTLRDLELALVKLEKRQNFGKILIEI